MDCPISGSETFFSDTPSASILTPVIRNLQFSPAVGAAQPGYHGAVMLWISKTSCSAPFRKPSCLGRLSSRPHPQLALFFTSEVIDSTSRATENWLCFVKSVTPYYPPPQLALFRKNSASIPKAIRHLSADTNRPNTGLASFEIAQLIDLMTENQKNGFVRSRSSRNGRPRPRVAPLNLRIAAENQPKASIFVEFRRRGLPRPEPRSKKCVEMCRILSVFVARAGSCPPGNITAAC